MAPPARVYHRTVPWLFVAVLLCAGCDRVFGLDRGDAGAIDGDGDGASADALPPAHPCLGRPAPPTFCYDFDEPTLVGYERDSEIPLSPVTLRVNLERRGPSATGPNGLWFTAIGLGIGVISASDAAITGHRIDATLSLRVGSLGTSTNGSSLLARLRVPQGTVPCELDLSLRKDDQHLLVVVMCAGAPPDATDLGSIDPRWVQLVMMIDTATGMASAAVGSMPPTVIGFDPSVMANTFPEARFGIEAATTGLSVGYDDVSIDMQ